MSTLIFDFDSTLISTESLDEILRKKLTPELFTKNREIMTEALAGQRDFGETLKERLRLTKLNKKDFEEYGVEALKHISPHLERFLEGFKGQVWIVSGSVVETLLPVAEKLRIPKERVIGIKAKWGMKGELKEIEDFTSKWEAANKYRDKWEHPVVAIGDAVTDYDLYRCGVVEYFIAYTGHVKRPSLMQLSENKISTFNDLTKMLALIST